MTWEWLQLLKRKGPDAALIKTLLDGARQNIEDLQAELRRKEFQVKEFEELLRSAHMPDEDCERRLIGLQNDYKSLTMDYIESYKIIELMKRDYEALRKELKKPA